MKILSTTEVVIQERDGDDGPDEPWRDIVVLNQYVLKIRDDTPESYFARYNSRGFEKRLIERRTRTEIIEEVMVK